MDNRLEEQNDTYQGPEGLGGWLILVGIGIILNPITGFFATATTYVLLSDDSIFAPYLDAGSSEYIPNLNIYLYSELLINAIILVLGVYFIYLFFKKKKKFVNYYFWFLLATFLFVFFDEMVYNSFFIVEEFPYIETARAVLPTIIWMLYLKKSVRVKNTFIY